MIENDKKIKAKNQDYNWKEEQQSQDLLNRLIL